MVNSTGSDDPTDPLSQVLEPPVNETSEQRAVRQAKEKEARWVSDRIDEQIKSEKQANSRSKTSMKVLVLGQAESGAPSSLIYPLLLPTRQHDTCPVLCIQASRQR
jgi:hypothetical protein